MPRSDPVTHEPGLYFVHNYWELFAVVLNNKVDIYKQITNSLAQYECFILYCIYIVLYWIIFDVNIYNYCLNTYLNTSFFRCAVT